MFCVLSVYTVQYQSKVWTHLLNQGFFFIFYYFLHCRIIVKTSKKSVKIYFIFEILQIATFCLDDSFAHSWYSLNQLHLECFSNSIEGGPTYAEHLWLLFLRSDSSQTILIWLRSGGLWRPGHLMHYSITLLLGQIALTQPGDVFGHCPDSPTKPKPDGIAYCCRMLW